MTGGLPILASTEESTADGVAVSGRIAALLLARVCAVDRQVRVPALKR